MPLSAPRGYIRREKIEIGTGRMLGSVYVPLRSSLTDFMGALEHCRGQWADICADAQVVAAYVTRPKLADLSQTLLDRKIGLVMSAQAFGQLPGRILAELVNVRLILDLPDGNLPWFLLADTPAIEEVRLGAEFATRSRRLRELPALQRMLSQLVKRVSLGAPTREWMADGMRQHFLDAGIFSLECPPAPVDAPDTRLTESPELSTTVIRPEFGFNRGEPYPSA